MEKKVLKVYDTISKKLVNVEVGEDVYKAYKRTEWSIENNDRAFQKHQIQFSELKGEVENFDEMASDDDSADSVERKLVISKLIILMQELSENDKELIRMLFFEKKTERECAELYGISQKNINKKKQRILCNLNKLLDDSNF